MGSKTLKNQQVKEKITSSLAKKNNSPASIEQHEMGILKLWESFATQLSNIKDEEVPVAVKFIDTMKKLSEHTRDMLKARVIELVTKNGKKVTEAGTMRMPMAGLVMEIQPTGNGYDPKKVEALIRAKGLDVEHYMDKEIKYSINEGKMKSAKKITHDEWETCRKEQGWKMMSPEKEN